MSKYCVKKPYTVVVAVVMVIVLGVISFMNMVTDLLPAMELPYVVVVTTMPGASPEQVESRITAPLEAGLGTVNGVTNVTSTSSENVSTVVLEFDGGTNMDSAMVNLSTAVDQVRGALPDTAGNPMLLQISPDMLPVMIAAVDMEGMDIYQLTDFASETVIPAFERQPGVASVSGTGLVEKSVEIRLSEEKIEAINTKVLASVDEELADAKAELDDAKKKVDDGRAELESGKTALENQQGDTAAELADASAQLDSAIAQAQALASQQTALEASKAALEAEKKGLEQAKGMQAELQKAAAGIVFSATTDMGGGALVPAPTDPEELARWEAAKAVPAVFIKEYISDEVWTTLWSAMAGSMPDALKTMSRTQFLTALDPDARIAEIDVALADLSTELMAAQVMAEQAKAGVEKAKEAYKKLEEGKILAAAGFGSASAQLAAAESALKEGEAQLEDAQKQFEDARKAALEQADVSQLLTKDLVSSLVMAQNFAMPAGYLYQGEDQYLLKVGDAFSSVEEVENALLLHMDAGDVGDVRLSDVADVTVIDNSGESYARMNGNPAVAVSIQKASTASTSEVSKTVNEAIEELEAKYPGLRITPLMDQGVYIQMTVDSVLSNLGWGAVLAVLVLALFLKDLRPTLVVAFSIPISLMFAVVLMYFSGVTLNMISLSGLALGVGMLVDNSIVVVENIYRLRSQGVPAAKAAVRGTRQVSGAIAASTLTTVCVFLPIVFTDGLTRQLFVDMGLTIAYSLLASLIVALTLVPTLSATMLRESKEKRHPWFDKMLAVYERALDFCLRVKVVPLALAAALLALCVWHTTQMGMEFIPNMSANQISATLTLPEDTKRADAYALTDEAMALMQQVEGVETVGAMDGGTGMSMMGMGGAGGSDTVESMSFYLVLDENADSEKTADDLTALSAQLPGCEVSVTTSSMDLSVLGGSGVELIVRGPDVDELNRITHDLMDILRGVEGLEEPTNGQEEGTPQLRLVVDKDAAMRCGLTAAQIYSELAAALTTETTSTTLTVGAEDYEVVVADERNKLDRDTLMQYEFEVTGTGPDAETETHTLSEFASLKDDFSLASVARENQQRYMTVSAAVKEGYNATLISRDIQPTLDSYDLPDGYTLEVGGETQTVADAMQDLVLMILLAVVFIYMIMVAQFQSLLGPFIVMLTMPLAFTGGLGALWIAGLPLSVISMLGFLILAGVVVNNGIVFVDYANQLRLEGMEKRAALIETGKTRMRPILMTALTTILAMSTMAFSTGMGAELSKPMALVTMGGLGYATLLTLFIVPVFYDLLFRKPLKKSTWTTQTDLCAAQKKGCQNRMTILFNCLVLVAGFVLLVKGADFFVDGSSGVARRLRVPGVVIGLTVVAMGTSLPEASVSITAGLTGNNGLSLGNVIGSNIFNLMVVACFCALVMSFVPDKELMVRDFPVCIGASALLVLFMWDDVLQRWEGIVMLGLMAAYIALTVVQALAARTPETEEEPVSLLRCVAFILLGMVAIIWGGDLVVDSASNIAAALGLSQTLIGLTIVAVGTSLPELATSIVAARKGESGLALGNAVGSCIFNILFILGASSALTPIESARGVLVDGVIMLVLTTALFIWCRIKGRMTKPMGAAGLLAYVAYTAYLIVNA